MNHSLPPFSTTETPKARWYHFPTHTGAIKIIAHLSTFHNETIAETAAVLGREGGRRGDGIVFSVGEDSRQSVLISSFKKKTTTTHQGSINCTPIPSFNHTATL